ncbi:GNAT family N-acetyltransferase [Gemmatimonadota bacterium]
MRLSKQMDAPRLPEMLETSRLLLRRPVPIDASAVFERWAQDPEVSRHLVWRPHESIEETHTHLAQCEVGWMEGTEFVWMIEEKASGGLVGSIAARPGAHGVNLGYLISRDAWGQGFMTEVLKMLVSRWLDLEAVHRVWATCDVENTASARVLEKAGFSLEGTLRRWEYHPNMGSEPRDALCFSCVRE